MSKVAVCTRVYVLDAVRMLILNVSGSIQMFKNIHVHFTCEYLLNMNEIAQLWLKFDDNKAVMWLVKDTHDSSSRFHFPDRLEFFSLNNKTISDETLAWFSCFSPSLIAWSLIRPELNRSPDFSLDYRVPPSRNPAAWSSDSRRIRTHGSRGWQTAGSNSSDMVLQATPITGQLKKDDIWLHPWSTHHQNTALVMFQACLRESCEALSVFQCYHDVFEWQNMEAGTETIRCDFSLQQTYLWKLCEKLHLLNVY